jgi:hypothetical protein
MTITLEHSPLPWAVAFAEDRSGIDYTDARIVQDANDDMRVAFLANDGTPANRIGRANARLIVRACNNHYALIEAFRSALKQLNEARGNCGFGGVSLEEIERYQAVLAKAEGK